MNQPLSRRQFLRASGIALALPALESLVPREARAASNAPKRMVFICTTLGILPANILPIAPGTNYPLTMYLEPFAKLREDFTLISGVSHPGVGNGHSSELSFLTSAPRPGSPSFRNSISVDQFALEKKPSETRVPSLQLTTGVDGTLSFNKSGIGIPSESNPGELYKRLFVTGSPAEIAEQTRRLRDGQSLLDLVASEARRLQAKVSQPDWAALDEYFTTVREVEKRLHAEEVWHEKPKPHVSEKPPQEINNYDDVIGRTRLMYDMTRLALETDTTRIATIYIAPTNTVPPIKGITEDWHSLTHHGKDPDKLQQLRVIELEQMKVLASFLEKMKSTLVEGEYLLDSTQVLYGSNLGNANSHDTRNLIVLIAGGGHKHGAYLAGNPEANTPLANVFVSMLRKYGLDVQQFGSSTGPIRAFETT